MTVTRREHIPFHDPAAYAEGLYEYGAPTLDAHSLHAWIVYRLGVDEGLDHARAEKVAELAIERGRVSRHARVGAPLAA